MQILLVRHAIAADTAPAGADADRPLTEEGRRRFERGARALAALVPELGLVATSPLRRARETAEILAAAFDARVPVNTAPALAPGAPGDAVVDLVAGWSDERAVALVGHEPDLTRLEGLLLTGRERSVAELKKGGAALLDLPDRIEAGAARLVWHLTAGQLRELAP